MFWCICYGLYDRFQILLDKLFLWFIIERQRQCIVWHGYFVLCKFIIDFLIDGSYSDLIDDTAFRVKREYDFDLYVIGCKIGNKDFGNLFFFYEIETIDRLCHCLDHQRDIRIAMYAENSNQLDHRFRTECLDRNSYQCRVRQNHLSEIKRPDSRISDADFFYPSEIYLIGVDFYDISHLEFLGVHHHDSRDHVSKDLLECQSYSEWYSSDDQSYIESHDFESDEEREDHQDIKDDIPYKFSYLFSTFFVIFSSISYDIPSDRSCDEFWNHQKEYDYCYSSYNLETVWNSAAHERLDNCRLCCGCCCCRGVH